MAITRPHKEEPEKVTSSLKSAAKSIIRGNYSLNRALSLLGPLLVIFLGLSLALESFGHGPGWKWYLQNSLFVVLYGFSVYLKNSTNKK